MGFPWRISTRTYMCNGNQYALQDIQYEEPEYRFQAIQDAERYVLFKNYGLSLMYYQKAITDNSLLPYSRELSEHTEWLFWSPTSIGIATQPAPDLTEHLRLAAYAYYRIILHLPREGTGNRSCIHVPNPARDLWQGSLRGSVCGDGIRGLGVLPIHAENVRWLRSGDPICGGTS